MEDRVYAVLMASGFSRRFGRANKLIVPFDGKPLARYTLELVLDRGFFFSSIFLVTAYDEVAVLGEDLSGITVIRNRANEKGQRESIRLGVEVSSLAEASLVSRAPKSGGEAYYLFFPCDQPFLDPPTVKRILEARRPGCIVEPCCRGEPGSPSLFSAFFKTELLSLGEGEHPRDIKKRNPAALISVELPDPLPLTDVDDSFSWRKDLSP
ncbi:MAG: nucleotidyltransferase family protein [Treponema sp.]|jgi:molybdenum cofactor cytidylyltransferase|nr:nucleotidyltransferase family protein [Treponema sp.]